MKNYNIKIAERLSYFSDLAYTPKSNINYELTEYSIIHLEDKGTDTQGFIAINDKELFIVFRGTTNLKDWKSNLDTRLTQDMSRLNLRYHRGFSEAYNSISEQVNAIVNINLDKDVYITGHSLGGALANICAVELSLHKDVCLEGLYTFGSPRVYDSLSAAYLNSILKEIHFRFVNNNDIVPHVPPEISDFSHWGRLMYFRDSGELLVDEDLSWWETIQYAAEGLIADIGELGIDAEKDHHSNIYHQFLENILTPAT